MLLKNETTCDVFVMGAGLAGIMAAVSAAEAGARVCLASASKICAGSSFYPGTWGLGLVGPDSPEDERDLEETILSVGEGMADPVLVHTLVSGIHDGIGYLERMGVELKEAEDKGQKEFIPCFDHKNRDWHGLVKESAREAFLRRLRELSVVLLEDTCVTDLVQDGPGGRVTGAVTVSGASGVRLFSCRSFVIASGGLGGLFSYRLNTDDVTGVGQYLALKAGAGLVNIEFMQMMPGFLHPAPKTIYNEKVFRYTDFSDPETGASVFADWDGETLARRMGVRSTHGPFTTRLLSAPVDVRLFEAFLRHPEGIRMTYKEELRGPQPEFIRTYFDWLWREKHLTVDDPVSLGIFAHASNGGIRIDENGYTGVPGLYACGEATGGMHGADRLGGLSTANGLVFGRRAGRAAAEDAAARAAVSDSGAACKKTAGGSGAACTVDYRPACYVNAPQILEALRQVNFANAMVLRSEAQCRETDTCLAKLRTQLQPDTAADMLPARLAASVRTEAVLCLTGCLNDAIRRRTESRGPHFRTDAPEKDDRLSEPTVITVRDGVLLPAPA